MSLKQSKPIPPRKPSKRKQAPQTSSEAQQLFQQIFHSVPAAILLTRLSDGLLADANTSFLKLTGYALNELVGLTSLQAGIVVDPKGREARLVALREGKPVPDFEVSVTIKSGEVRHGLATVGNITIAGEQFAITTFIDITERIQAERQVLQMKRLYATLSQVNQTIVRVRDQDDLYQSICNIAVEFGEFSLAWVGLLDETSGEIRPVAATGLDVAHWPFPIVNIHQGNGSDGLAATAIRTARVVTSEDIQTDERTHKQHDQIRRFAFHSSAAVPFRLKGNTIGILGLVSEETGLFKAEEEVLLLEEMGLDISFALDTIEVEAARKRAEKQALDQAARLKILADASQVFAEVGQDRQALLDQVVRLIADALADTCYIRLLSDDGQRLDLGALQMNDPEVLQVWGTILARETLSTDDLGLVSQVFRTGRHAFAPILQREQLQASLPEKFRPYLDRFAPHSMIVVPLSVQGYRIGALIVIRHLPEQPSFTEDDVRLSQDLADRAALAIHSTQLFEQVQRELAERKQAEERFRLAIESAPNAIIMVDQKGQIILVNSQTEKYFGYDRIELMGGSIDKLVPARFRGNHATHRAEFFSQPGARSMGMGRDLYGLRKDGSEFPVEIGLAPIETQQGMLVLATIVDITRRKQIEAALSESEAHYRQIIETAQEGIWTIDTDARTTLANQRLADMLGYSIEEMMGKSIYEFMDEEGQTIAATNFENQTLGINEQLDFKYKHKDGSTVWAITEMSSLYDQDGNYTGALAMLTDITERKWAEKKIRSQLERLNALREVDIAISASFGTKISLDAVVSRAVVELNIDAADILVLNPKSAMLEYRAGWGFGTKLIQNSPLRVGEGIAGGCAQSGEPVHIRDLREHADEFVRKELLIEEEFIGYYCIPLIDKTGIQGVLEIFHRSLLDPEQEWVDFLHTLAGQAAIAIEKATLFEGLQRSNTELAQAYDATIVGWSRAMDLRDKETAGHTQRVTELTLELAQAVGMSDEELVHVRRGALLHDMGKLGVPDDVLLKPGKLTDEEWVAMRKHPQHAYDMLSFIQYLRPALDIPYCHHEKWDGTGYPRGLKGEQIPLAARLFAVVDVWDALRSDRPYRPSWPEERVLEYIRMASGTHFDPKAVELFLQVIGEKSHYAEQAG